MKRMFTALTALIATGAIAYADPPKPAPSCFFVHESWSWKAPDARTMYIKVFPNKYYRLDLAAQCPSLLWPDAQLITVHRSDSICNALDWDLKVKEGFGSIAVPCIVKKMTPLTSAEADQIPPKFRPN